MFCTIDLVTEVDLSKAKATFNEGTLEGLMPKVAPAKSVRVETKLLLSAESHTSVHERGGIAATGSAPVLADPPRKGIYDLGYGMEPGKPPSRFRERLWGNQKTLDKVSETTLL
jgi:hypothetical protein